MVEKQKKRSFTTDDPRLGALMEEGIDGNIVILGFPFDLGGKRDGIQPGQDNGPDCLRRFLGKCGPVVNSEYEIDISHLKITDYGNLALAKEKPQPTLEDYLEKLEQKVNSVRGRNGVAIVIGGTKDCLYAGGKSLISRKKTVGIMNVTSYFDMKPMYDGDKVSHLSATKKLISEFTDKFNDELLQIFYFGLQEQSFSKEEKEFLKLEHKRDSFHICTMGEIRTTAVGELSPVLLEPITQGGIRFKKYLERLSANVEELHLSFSLEAINSCYCPGVSNPSVAGGLTSEEAIEVMMLAGMCEKLGSLDLTDYNPSVEDFRTGRLLANLIYFFIMGYSLRNARLS